MPFKGTLTKAHIVDAVIEANGFTRRKSVETVETLVRIPMPVAAIKHQTRVTVQLRQTCHHTQTNTDASQATKPTLSIHPFVDSSLSAYSQSAPSV